MNGRVTLTLFAHLTSRPEASIDLAEATLLIAATANPALDVAGYVRKLDDHAEAAKRELTAESAAEPITRVTRYLYEAAGFRGNSEDYYDPENSFLDRVIDRRTGIPITLAVVLLEVCRRAGVAAHGVSFPGHFLVRADVSRGTIIVDPFSGRMLAAEELRTLYARGTGRPPPGELTPRMFEAATKAQILARMLTNLCIIYEKKGDTERLRPVLELLHVVAPSDDLEARIKAVGGSVYTKPRVSGMN